MRPTHDPHLLELEISGQLDAFRTLMNEMVPATTQEKGCLTYDWYIMADGSEVHLQERYADNDAALVHLGNFGAHSVYGPANDAVQGALSPLGAIFMDHFGGFRR